MPPSLDARGRLPDGRHSCSLEELRARFVEQAPKGIAQRQRIWRAFEVYVDLVRRRIPGARLWVNGGFVTHKADPPSDIDVVIIVPAAWSPKSTQEQQDVKTLLTLQGADLGSALSAAGARLRPMGGLVDGFLARDDDFPQLDYWDHQWSSVNGAATTARKGYVEVTL